MTHRPSLTVATAALAFTVAASAVRAQAPKGADTLSRRAIADSLRVLERLSVEVKQKPKDAQLWFHRAMVAFALAERADQKDTVTELDYRKLRLIAGDSFLEAVNLDPKNGKYLQEKSRFALTDHYYVGRIAGRPPTCDVNLDHFTDADITLRQSRLVDMGWVCWVDFDGYENRGQSSFADANDPQSKGNNGTVKIPVMSGHKITIDPPAPAAPSGVTDAARSILSASVDPCWGTGIPLGAIMDVAAREISETLFPLPFDVAGETDYLGAKRMFEAAYALDPKGPRAYSSLTMLLAARDDWAALQRIARRQTLATPDDPWVWMTVALATYRLHPGKESRELFDSAFARLDDAERKRLDRLDRVLRPADSVRYATMDAATRADAAHSSWLLADPLWSTPGADPRTEFLARVTYAEVRWSLPGFHTHGADTDRGRVYIRYGPPNKIVGFQDSTDSTHAGVMHAFWVYNGNLVFNFDKRLHTGVATVNPCDVVLLERTISEVPARWDNIATSRIDSMPTQAARFRAGTDSVELFLATKAPVDTMRALAGLANTQPLAHLWLVPFGPGLPFLDSVRLGTTGNLQWTRRVAPGPYYYRVEATAPGILVSGRTAAQMMLGPDSASGFRLIGFGLSDVIVASRAGGAAAPHRWSDLDIVPVLGSIAKGSEVALVWENYELGRQGASAHYDVAVTIDRELTKSGQIGARIANIVGVGVSAGKDKVAMKFDRTVPFAPVLTENVTLALRDTPPGSYRITVQVTDRVSGRSASRTVRIVIHE